MFNDEDEGYFVFTVGGGACECGDERDIGVVVVMFCAEVLIIALVLVLALMMLVLLFLGPWAVILLPTL